MTSGRHISQLNSLKDELPVLAYWNYTSAPISGEQMTVFIAKMEEKISRSMQVSLMCDVRCTDTSVINVVEQEYPNFTIYHASPSKIVDRICTEMKRHTSLFEKPGLVVLISDSGNYTSTLSSLSTIGWRTLIICPNTLDYTFLDSAKECLQMDELVDFSIAPNPYEARCFLLQIPSIPQDKFNSLLSKDQQCVYFNSRSGEAVIVIEAENQDYMQKRLESLIERVCATTGLCPADILPFPPNSFKCVVGLTPSKDVVQLVIFDDNAQHLSGDPQLMTSLSHYSNGITHNKSIQFTPTYGPEPAPQCMQKSSTREPAHDAQKAKQSLMNPSDLVQGLTHLDDSPPPEPQQSATMVCSSKTMSESFGGFNADEKICPGMNQVALSKGGFCKSENKQEGANRWMNSFGGNPWKQAEENFIRRTQPPSLQHNYPQQCQELNSNVTPNGTYCETGIQESVTGKDMGCDRENQNNSDYYFAFGNKQNGQRKQQERFRKPAPQCVFWENRRHRQETGCTLWHPRESCRFYPTCAHQARDCGFAHPFCGPRCECLPTKRNPQMNHWTEHLEKNFGTLPATL
ncbi:unnamed protein product, partial [Mesorhabditis belari]|uniref:Uncharacterized protein n=1 Tax=Mesorhabditis belari TaxID=2138241 RepID=A0AAF3EPL4_9BILA